MAATDTDRMEEIIRTAKEIQASPTFHIMGDIRGMTGMLVTEIIRRRPDLKREGEDWWTLSELVIKALKQSGLLKGRDLVEGPATKSGAVPDAAMSLDDITLSIDSGRFQARANHLLDRAFGAAQTTAERASQVVDELVHSTHGSAALALSPSGNAGKLPRLEAEAVRDGYSVTPRPQQPRQGVTQGPRWTAEDRARQHRAEMGEELWARFMRANAVLAKKKGQDKRDFWEMIVAELERAAGITA
jgi:hypothetical protein